MPRGRPRKIKEEGEEDVEEEEEEEEEEEPAMSEKERLMGLYEELKSLKVNSLGDLENRIAQAE